MSDLARDLDLARNRVLASDLALALHRRAGDLTRALDRASDRVGDLASAGDLAPSVRGKLVAVRLAPTAGRLLAAASRLLPAADRARYSEEFRSELWEIAAAGTGRRGQLAYAARQVASSLRVRAELRAPRRRRVAP